MWDKMKTRIDEIKIELQELFKKLDELQNEVFTLAGEIDPYPYINSDEDWTNEDWKESNEEFIKSVPNDMKITTKPDRKLN